MKKHAYDAVWKEEKGETHFKSLLPETLVTALKTAKVQRILEIGSGAGENAILLSKAGYTVTAIDISSEGIAQTKEAAATENITIDARCLDMHKPLPFKEDTFDAIIALQSINHGTKSQVLSLLTTMSKLVRPRGLLAIKTAIWENYHLEPVDESTFFDVDYQERLEFIEEQTYKPLEGPEKGIIHYAFRKEELREALVSQGLQIKDQEEHKGHLLIIAVK